MWSVNLHCSRANFSLLSGQTVLVHLDKTAHKGEILSGSAPFVIPSDVSGHISSRTSPLGAKKILQ